MTTFLSKHFPSIYFVDIFAVVVYSSSDPIWKINFDWWFVPNSLRLKAVCHYARQKCHTRRLCTIIKIRARRNTANDNRIFASRKHSLPAHNAMYVDFNVRNVEKEKFQISIIYESFRLKFITELNWFCFFLLLLFRSLLHCCVHGMFAVRFRSIDNSVSA